MRSSFVFSAFVVLVALVGQARADSFSFGFRYGHQAPAPVYVEQAPVYVLPPVVVEQPPEVVVETVPVYVAPRYYAAPRTVVIGHPTVFARPALVYRHYYVPAYRAHYYPVQPRYGYYGHSSHCR